MRFMWAVAIAGLLGCGGKDRIAVSPVHGQVTYNGRGVANATIIFHPVGEVAEQLQKMRPYAYADDNGRFELKTYVTGDGAPPGEYEVGIIAGGGSDRDSGVGAGASGRSLPRNLMKKYANQKTSGIKVTIRAGENELEPFVLN
jgi:hypothetical protein